MGNGKTEDQAYSVSELTATIKGLLEADAFKRIFIDGEISGWKVYSSGHAYFNLKDERSILPCVMFAPYLLRCPSRDLLEDGARVCAWGELNVYAPNGRYQFLVRAAKPQGAGELMLKFEALKKRLAAEGLFDESKKKPLPFLPEQIGVVTSPKGAVIHDMCNVLTRRFPGVGVMLKPVKVQGPGSAEEIAAAIAAFNAKAKKPDLLIVARGGGSLEDLWAFNEETVVRAVAASKIPIISAVGHETDFTLCDFAADVRAGTPSIAAEIAVPVKDELVARVDELKCRLARAPQRHYEFLAQRLDHLALRLSRAPQECLQAAAHRLDEAKLRLKLLNPANELKRGYSITLDAQGKTVRKAAKLKAGDVLVTRLASGSVKSVVNDLKS